MTEEQLGGVIAGVYNELQPQLARILASNLQAPTWVIDDACQTAWRSWLEHRAALAPKGELGWLSTTATREALRLLRQERTTDRQEQPAAPPNLAEFRVPQPEPERQLELRERLAEVRRLPLRQQRVLMLHGFGYEYEEIAAVTGYTRRTVARQLSQARQRLRLVASDG